MFAEERCRQISGSVSAEDRVTVAGLSSRLRIIKETVRRDLALLETDGVLRRVHGGAIAGSGAPIDEPSLIKGSRPRGRTRHTLPPGPKAIPKEMLPVVDKPTIQYVVEEAVAAHGYGVFGAARTGWLYCPGSWLSG